MDGEDRREIRTREQFCPNLSGGVQWRDGRTQAGRRFRSTIASPHAVRRDDRATLALTSCAASRVVVSRTCTIQRNTDDALSVTRPPPLLEEVG